LHYFPVTIVSAPSNAQKASGVTNVPSARIKFKKLEKLIEFDFFEKSKNQS
jgi:hypothetical protein